jgi:hypothetical protein
LSGRSDRLLRYLGRDPDRGSFFGCRSIVRAEPQVAVLYDDNQQRDQQQGERKNHLANILALARGAYSARSGFELLSLLQHWFFSALHY